MPSSATTYFRTRRFLSVWLRFGGGDVNGAASRGNGAVRCSASPTTRTGKSSLVWRWRRRNGVIRVTPDPSGVRRQLAPRRACGLTWTHPSAARDGRRSSVARHASPLGSRDESVRDDSSRGVDLVFVKREVLESPYGRALTRSESLRSACRRSVHFRSPPSLHHSRCAKHRHDVRAARVVPGNGSARWGRGPAVRYRQCAPVR